jgi:hypothetical protein
MRDGFEIPGSLARPEGEENLLAAKNYSIEPNERVENGYEMNTAPTA